jgi:peptidoglycan/LPS O-acetylase OafA/YrhL
MTVASSDSPSGVRKIGQGHAKGIQSAHHALTHLDAVRGLAALAVVLYHLREIFFVPSQEVARMSVIIKGIYVLSGLGHQAVMVFFVLSGFFISSSVLRSVRSGRWSWRKYLVQRLTRLYTVLLPALCLGAVLDCAGMALFGTHSIYPQRFLHVHDAFPEQSFASRTTPLIWVGNLFFLQGIYVPQFGSNNPLWSLSYEFWYYLLFPLVALTVVGDMPVGRKVLYAATALAVLCFVGPTIALDFLIWLLGAALCLMRPSSWAGTRLFGATSFSALCFFMGAYSVGVIHLPFVPDFLIGLTFAAFMYYLLSVERRQHSAWYTKIAQTASNVSYTEYLIHYPFLVFLNACVVRTTAKWQPDRQHLAAAAGLLVCTLLYVAVVWWLTEAKTDKIRALLSPPAAKTA